MFRYYNILLLGLFLFVFSCLSGPSVEETHKVLVAKYLNKDIYEMVNDFGMPVSKESNLKFYGIVTYSWGSTEITPAFQNSLDEDDGDDLIGNSSSNSLIVVVDCIVTAGFDTNNKIVLISVKKISTTGGETGCILQNSVDILNQ